MPNFNKVLILSTFPFPNGKATSNRIKIFAHELEKKEYVEGIKVIATSNVNNEIIYSNKINIKNFKVNFRNKDKYFRRFFFELFVAIKLWNKSLKEKPHIIIVSIPSILLLIPILFTRTKAKIILDVRDTVWDYIPKTILGTVIRVILRMIFKLSTYKVKLVTTTNQNEAKSINLITGKMPVVVGNGISKEYFEALSKISVKNINKEINLVYLGNIGIAQELEILIAFAKKNKNIIITIVGDGTRLNYIMKLCSNEKISNINFKKPINFDQISNLYRKSDILFAQIGASYTSAIPSKIFEYIASGRLILLGLPEGAAKKVFSSFNGVEIFNTGDVKAMSNSLKKLVDNPFTENLRNDNLKKLSKNYIRENHVNLMIKSIEKIV